MKTNLIEFIDFEKVDTLLEGFNKSTGFVTAILDLKGNVLSKSGWRQICTEFHRIHPETSKKCTISDTELSGRLAKEEKYHFYKCLNGLVDVAVPIVINGEHIANLFSGQFFFEKPDLNFFKKQAKEFGFDEKKYLRALKKVPVVSNENVNVKMDFLLDMTQLISEMTFQKIKQTELNKTLQESEERFRTFVMAASESTFRMSPDWSELYELNGKGFLVNNAKPNPNWIQKYIPIEDQSIVMSAIQKAIKTKSIFLLEHRIWKADGSRGWANSRAVPRMDENGEIFEWFGAANNITEHKQSETQLKKYTANLKSLIDNRDDSIWSLDRNYIFTIFNRFYAKEFFNAFKFNIEIGMCALDTLTPEAYEFWVPKYERVFAGESISFGLERFFNNSKHFYQVSLNPIFEESIIIGASAISIDITDRFLAQEKERESEEKYRLLHEAAGVGIGYYTTEGIVISYNTIAAKNMNGNSEDFVGKSIFDLFPKPEAELYLKRIKNAAISEKPNVYEDKVDLPTGVRWFNSVFTRIVNSNDSIAGIQIISNEITDRKLVEDQQQNLYKQLNRIASNVPGALYEFCLKPDGTSFIPYASEGFSSIYGLTLNEVKTDATPLFQRIHPEDIENLNKSILESAANLTPWHNENRVIFPTGKIIWVEGKSIPQKLKDGSIIWQGYINNITERKLVEEELKLSEERFEKSFKLSPYLVSLTSMDGQVLEVNDMIFETFGYTREEFLGNNTTVLPIWVHPEERAASIKQLKQNGILREMEVKYRKKSGQISDFLLSAVIIELNNEKVLLSIIHDISERKEKEKELEDSEAQFKALGEFSPLAIYSSSGSEQKAQYINPAFHRIFGFTREDVPNVGEWWIKAFPDEKYRQWVMETWQKNIDDANLNNTSVAPLECVCNCKDGSQKIISWEGQNIGNQFWAFGLDLTDHIQAQEALKKSEETYRLLFESISDAILVTQINDDNTFSYINVNNVACELYGYNREEFLTKSPNDIISENEKKTLKERVQKVLNSDNSVLTTEHIKKNGQTFPVEISARTSKIRNKNIITAIIRDITERKKAEEMIQKSEERYRTLFENITSGFVLFEVLLNKNGVPADLIILAANEKFEETTGLKLRNAIGQHLTQVLPGIENDEARWIETYAEVAITGVPKEFEQGSELLGFYYSVKSYKSGPNQCAVIFDDITERKKAEEELRSTRELLNNAIENAPMGTCLVKTDGYFSMVNKSLCEMFGYTETELKSKSFLEVTHPDDYDIGAKTVQAMIKGESEKVIFEKRYLKKNGDIFHAKVQSSVLKDKTGNPIYFFTHIENITDRKLAQIALQKSEEKYKLLFELSPYSLIVTRNGLIETVNASALELFGLENKSDILETDPMNWVDKESFEIAKSRLNKLYEKKVKMPLAEYNILRKNGEIRNIDAQSASMTDEKGIYSLAVLRDITERKQIEKDLKESNELLRLSTELANVAAWEFNFESNSMSRSNNHDSLYGLVNQKKWAFETFSNATHPDDREMSTAIIQNSIAAGGPDKYKFDFRIIYPDGSIHWLNVIGEVIKRNEKGIGIIVRGFLIDITERKTAEEEINRLNTDLELRVIKRTAQLEASNKELEAFSYSVSHDLRSPLRAIDGFSKFLIEDFSDKLDDEGKRLLKIIRENTIKMDRLIADMLNLSRVTMTDLNYVEINMKDMAEGMYHEVANDEEKKYFSLILGEIPNINGDSGLIKQVWSNLIRNALKYSRNSEIKKITIGCEVKDDKFIYFIHDNGAGFNQKYISKLFGVFQRLHTDSEFEGTGVGLAIIKRIILKHNGKVWAEGEVNKGATFYFSLPAK